jgi:hypothetical protein
MEEVNKLMKQQTILMEEQLKKATIIAVVRESKGPKDIEKWCKIAVEKGNPEIAKLLGNEYNNNNPTGIWHSS